MSFMSGVIDVPLPTLSDGKIGDGKIGDGKIGDGTQFGIQPEERYKVKQ